jgi:hypothetical protein
MDANTVNYTIVNFDATNRIVGVTFDNSPAIINISLVAPLPKNQQELEHLIKQYTAPVEIVQARSDSETDLSFIADLVNNTITTTRFSIRPKSSQLDENIRAQLAKNREIQQKSDLANTLISFGLLQTNPVDLSQIMQVALPIANT